MIPQPTASRSVSRATSGDSAVEERASIECLRHHGYASASQIVSKPPSSSARACSRISSSGSMVSCMTPMRSGGMPRINQARASTVECVRDGHAVVADEAALRGDSRRRLRVEAEVLERRLAALSDIDGVLPAASGAKELHELEIGVDANSGRKLVALEPAPRRIVLPVLVGRAEDVAACALDLGAFPACEHEREPDLPDRLTAGKPGIAGRQIRALE